MLFHFVTHNLLIRQYNKYRVVGVLREKFLIRSLVDGFPCCKLVLPVWHSKQSMRWRRWGMLSLRSLGMTGSKPSGWRMWRILRLCRWFRRSVRFVCSRWLMRSNFDVLPSFPSILLGDIWSRFLFIIFCDSWIWMTDLVFLLWFLWLNSGFPWLLF